MNHKEMTAHIRKRIKAAGIPALCKMQYYGISGGDVISVDVPTHDTFFTPEQQRNILLIAKVNRLTLSRGMAIDLTSVTNPQCFKFFMAQ